MQCIRRLFHLCVPSHDRQLPSRSYVPSPCGNRHAAICSRRHVNSWLPGDTPRLHAEVQQMFAHHDILWPIEPVHPDVDTNRTRVPQAMAHQQKRMLHTADPDRASVQQRLQASQIDNLDPAPVPLSLLLQAEASEMNGPKEPLPASPLLPLKPERCSTVTVHSQDRSIEQASSSARASQKQPNEHCSHHQDACQTQQPTGRGIPSHRKRPSVFIADAIQEYLEGQRTQHRRPKTLEWHETALRLFGQYLQTEQHCLLIDRITPFQVQSWLTCLAETPTARGTIRSPGTVQSYARSARAFCQWAVERRYRKQSPFTDLLLPHPKTAASRVITTADHIEHRADCGTGSCHPLAALRNRNVCGRALCAACGKCRPGARKGACRRPRNAAGVGSGG